MSRATGRDTRPTERALENSESEFAREYAQWAAQGQLYPSREGSPLLEFSSAGRVLYLFDRMGPYTSRPGAARVIVHGILNLDALEVLDGEREPPEQLTSTVISGVEGVGRVLHASRRTWVVQARLPLVLSAFEALPEVKPGAWVRFATVPPLHGFVVE